jgi:hypothetical protein
MTAALNDDQIHALWLVTPASGGRGNMIIGHSH